MSSDLEADARPNIKRIYFYTVETNGCLKEHFIRSNSFIPYDRMPDLIREIAREIDDGSIPPSVSEQGRRTWRRRSYFVYYDEYKRFKKGNAVSFSSDSFRDGAEVLEGEEVLAFYCINHARNAGGDVEPGKTEEVRVNVYHEQEHEHEHGHDDEPAAAGDDNGGAQAGPGKAARASRGRLTHNDSGTNTGPPVP